jgi:hypothetical protein
MRPSVNIRDIGKNCTVFSKSEMEDADPLIVADHMGVCALL